MGSEPYQREVLGDSDTIPPSTSVFFFDYFHLHHLFFVASPAHASMYLLGSIHSVLVIRYSTVTL